MFFLGLRGCQKIRDKCLIGSGISICSSRLTIWEIIDRPKKVHDFPVDHSDFAKCLVVHLLFFSQLIDYFSYGLFGTFYPAAQIVPIRAGFLQSATGVHVGESLG